MFSSPEAANLRRGAFSKSERNLRFRNAEDSVIDRLLRRAKPSLFGRNKAFLLLTAAGSSFYKVTHRGYSVESTLDVGLCIVDVRAKS